MYQYANGYSCAMDNDKNTVVLHFRQSGPKFGRDGTVEETEVVPVASIIMNLDMAHALGKSLCSLIEEADEED